MASKIESTLFYFYNYITQNHLTSDTYGVDLYTKAVSLDTVHNQ